MSPDLWGEGLVILALIAVSAFFSGSETVLTGLSPVALHRIRQKRGRRAAPLALWEKYPNRFLVTILVGNNLVNITASALAGDLAQRVFAHQGLSVAVAVMTLLVLVFGEITPKTFARANAERLALPIAHVLRGVYYLFLPVTWLLVRFTRGVMRLAGSPDLHRPVITEEDVDWAILMGRRYGALPPEKERMFTAILQFSSRTVREILVPRTDMVTLDVQASYAQALALVHQAGHSRLPVYEDRRDNIIGVLYVKDLLAADVDRPPLRRLLRPALFVPEQKRILDLLKEFQREVVHIAVVVDEYGAIAGLVTMEDILEEIVGEIRDEHDAPDLPLVDRLGPDRWLADARTPVDDLSRVLQRTLPKTADYESLGGFLIALAGRVPDVGQRLRWREFTFLVREGDARHVQKVEVRRRSGGEAEPAPPDDRPIPPPA